MDELKKIAEEFADLRAATDGEGDVIITKTDYDSDELARFRVADGPSGLLITRAINFAGTCWYDLIALQRASKIK